MRVEQIRLGVQVVLPPKYQRNTSPTPLGKCGVIIKISKTAGTRERFLLTIQTEEGEVQRRADQVKFVAVPVLRPSSRRTIWIRRDVAGPYDRFARTELKLFYWKEPPEEIRGDYYSYYIHLSRVDGLSRRADLLKTMERERDEVWTELRDHLYFLKEEGAMPVDMATPNCTINGQQKEERYDGNRQVDCEDRSVVG